MYYVNWPREFARRYLPRSLSLFYGKIHAIYVRHVGKADDQVHGDHHFQKNTFYNYFLI